MTSEEALTRALQGEHQVKIEVRERAGYFEARVVPANLEESSTNVAPRRSPKLNRGELTTRRRDGRGVSIT